MIKAKVKFLWYKVGDIIKESDYDNVPIWIKDGLVEDDSIQIKTEVIKKKNELDLNDDGKIDKIDKSIAGKVLAHGRKKPGRPKKK